MLALPLDGGAMRIAFMVEVAEGDFGHLEKADVVPGQRFDDVCADAWVIAGRAELCLFGRGSAGCYVSSGSRAREYK